MEKRDTVWQRWHSQTCKIRAVFPAAPISSICLPPFLLLTLLTKPKAFQDVCTNNWTFFLARPLLISQGRKRTGCAHLQLFLWAKTLSNCSGGASLHLLTRNSRSGFTKKEGQRWGNGGINKCPNSSCRNSVPSPTIPWWRELTMFVLILPHKLLWNLPQDKVDKSWGCE